MPNEKEEPDSLALAPGTLIAGKYRVERVVGQGGMGVVLAARHEELDQLVAIKLLRPSGDRDIAGARFLREARAAARLQSDHAAKVFDVGTLDSGHAYMVMEHLDGADLEAVLASRGPLPIDEAVDHVLEALDAIAQAHAHGIVHRDLKPSNLFLTRLADGSQRIKVLDFGISKTMTPLGTDAAPGTLTGADTILGTPAYMSPEQLKNSKEVDVRSDVWAIGVILYELISGTIPFNGQTVGEIFAAILEDTPVPLRARRPGAPAELEAVVARCLTRDRALRYPDVSALASALAPFGSARTTAFPARIAQFLGQSEPVPATTMRGSFPSLPEQRVVSETATTADLAPPPQAPRPRGGPAVQTASTWSRRSGERKGSKRWVLPLATLGLGLAAGLAFARHALQNPSASPQVTSVAATPLPSAPGASVAPEPPGATAPLGGAAPPSSSALVPTVEPAPATVEMKTIDSAPHASATAAPRASSAVPRVAAPSAKPSAQPAVPRKSPADLMKERD